MITFAKEDNEKVIKYSKNAFKERFTYLVGLLIAFSVVSFLFPYTTVVSSSMTPTLRVKDFVVSTRFIDKDNLKRGDIILFYDDKETFLERSSIVKRIIGLPGEKVSIKKGVVFINGVPIEEDYVNNKNSYFSENNQTYMDEIIVPEESYFVLGDNRNNSIDSRDYGCIKKSQISKKPLIEWSKTEKKIKTFF